MNQQFHAMMNVKTMLSQLLICLLLSGCYKEISLTNDTITIQTPDWTEASHGNSVDPNYNILFDNDEVLEFNIVIDPEDWEIMQTDLKSSIGQVVGPPGVQSGSDPIWVPCSVLFNDTEWYKVGIRYKGNSSLQSSVRSGIHKLSFKIDFDQFEDQYPAIKNQRFYGFKQLNLKNNFDDQSLVREKVASDLFREFGLASPHCAFSEVYVDYGQGIKYFGLYTLVEEVDDTVLDSQFGSNEGNLYKPDGKGASFRSGLYRDADMEKKNNLDTGDYSDVISLYNTINSNLRQSDPDLWKESLEGILDVPVFINWLAANTVMQNWDTYGIMAHNYYLYNNPSSGLLTWIPWDNNEALQEGKQGGALSLSLDEVNSQWPLIRYLMDVDEYYEQYRTACKRFVEEVFLPAKMVLLYEKYRIFIERSAYAEEQGYTFLRNSASFRQAHEALKSHVQQRYDAVSGNFNLT